MKFEIWKLDKDYHQIYHQSEWIATIQEVSRTGLWILVDIANEKEMPHRFLKGLEYNVLLDELYHELFVQNL